MEELLGFDLALESFVEFEVFLSVCSSRWLLMFKIDQRKENERKEKEERKENERKEKEEREEKENERIGKERKKH